MPFFEFGKLEGDCKTVFECAGLDAEEAQRVASSLVMSNLMGHDSHGVIRLVQYVQALEDEIVKAGRRIEVIREAEASAVVDGGWGFGQHPPLPPAPQNVRRGPPLKIGTLL